jgi:hypothetical protein
VNTRGSILGGRGITSLVSVPQKVAGWGTEPITTSPWPPTYHMYLGTVRGYTKGFGPVSPRQGYGAASGLGNFSTQMRILPVTVYIAYLLRLQVSPGGGYHDPEI